MHAHPQIKRLTAVEYSSFGLVLALAWVCKVNGPLPPAPTSPEQEQEYPWGISKLGGLSFPQQVAGVVSADCKPRQPGRLAGVSGNEHTSTNSVMMVIY